MNLIIQIDTIWPPFMHMTASHVLGRFLLFDNFMILDIFIKTRILTAV